MQCQDSYFPIFLSLKNRRVLLVGGGKIANDKLEKLLDFTKDIKIISPKFSSNILTTIDKHSLDFETREYKKADIKDFDIAIVAVDDVDLQKSIYQEAKEYKVLVNSVDSKEYCDFLFGSIIKKGDLTILIGTNGVSPAISRYLKIFLNKVLPSDIDEFIKEMKKLRQTLPKGIERMKLLEKKAKDYFYNKLGF